MNYSGKQRTVGGLPLRVEAQLLETDQDLGDKGNCPRGVKNARTIDSKDTSRKSRSKSLIDCHGRISKQDVSSITT